MTDDIPQGRLLRLDPAVDTSGLAPVPRMVAAAAQRHGFIVTDEAGRAAETPAARAARARQRWRVQKRDGRWEVVPPRDHWVHKPVRVWLLRAGSIAPASYRDTVDAARRWSSDPEQFHEFVLSVLRASFAALPGHARVIREDLFRGPLVAGRVHPGRELLHPWGEADRAALHPYRGDLAAALQPGQNPDGTWRHGGLPL